MIVEWTDYFKYRIKLRKFDLDIIERILKHTTERYLDTVTMRRVAVGRHYNILIMIPYEVDKETITPITVHATSRQQIKFRFRTGRFIHE